MMTTGGQWWQGDDNDTKIMTIVTKGWQWWKNCEQLWVRDDQMMINWWQWWQGDEKIMTMRIKWWRNDNSNEKRWQW